MMKCRPTLYSNQYSLWRLAQNTTEAVSAERADKMTTFTRGRHQLLLVGLLVIVHLAGRRVAAGNVAFRLTCKICHIVISRK